MSRPYPAVAAGGAAVQHKENEMTTWGKAAELISREIGCSKEKAESAIGLMASNGIHLVMEDHLMQMTAEIDCHPEEYDGPCDCELCRSYG